MSFSEGETAATSTATGAARGHKGAVRGRQVLGSVIAAVVLGLFITVAVETTAPRGVIAGGGAVYLTLWTMALHALWWLSVVFHVFYPSVWTRVHVSSSWVVVFALGATVVLVFWSALVPGSSELQACLRDPWCGFRTCMAHGGVWTTILAAPWVIVGRSPSHKGCAAPWVRLVSAASTPWVIALTTLVGCSYVSLYAAVALGQGRYVYGVREVLGSNRHLLALEPWVETGFVAAAIALFLLFLGMVLTSPRWEAWCKRTPPRGKESV